MSKKLRQVVIVVLVYKLKILFEVVSKVVHIEDNLLEILFNEGEDLH